MQIAPPPSCAYDEIIQVVIRTRRHVLFEHSTPLLSQHYPRFAKRLGGLESCLLSFDELYFLVNDGFKLQAEGGDGECERRPRVAVSFASEQLRGEYDAACANCACLCAAYSYLTRHKGWILRHAGATFGADYIGYRRRQSGEEATVTPSHRAVGKDEEGSLRHGEALFIVGALSTEEAIGAARVARSVGKRVFLVTQEESGAFEVTAVENLCDLLE